jgi:hypothetical protein
MDMVYMWADSEGLRLKWHQSKARLRILGRGSCQLKYFDVDEVTVER